MVNLKRIKKYILLIFLFFLIGEAGYSNSSFANPHPSSHLEIQSGPEQVFIFARSYPLGNLLQEIHYRTGIQFNIPDPLKSVSVDIQVLQGDWKSALKNLFQENSRLEKWGVDLAASKIWLFEYENYPVSSADFIVRVDAKEKLTKQEILRLAQKANDIEKRLMATEHFSYLAEDEEVLALLLQNLDANEKAIRSLSLELMKNLSEPIPLLPVGKVSISDPDPEIRMQALSLITERADEEGAKPYLLQALHDPSIETQTLARELLTDLGFSDI
ncbi:MAG: hypothetical protein VW455_08465 [Nitrospinota bacterium]